MKDSIEAIEKLFLEGLQDSAQTAAGGQKNTAQEGGRMAASVRYSYAGINAADADLKGLSKAMDTRTHNLNKLLAEENLLWLGENKKETRAWFNALGRSTPFGGTKSGFIRILSQSGSKSQGGYPNSLIRYQERDPGLNRVNEVLRTQKEGLREDFDEVKAIF